ncbi:uncharacterized protein BX663DRAFT_427791 [Cokeromyces recurvatus]|uniref:uncharacterized protein n=1 Tax=Cokeromyces recurvatus TaxID=90255 RepID=UPI00222056E0|nr:uncharacterized protein BX663DRAFT_427791 [Cokeromyces recurvatus]KAI7906366.1 hypothetical protein BX663DRAFT_427791 [Cokeromyces recurvatus]
MEKKKRLNSFNEYFNKVQKEYNNNLEIIKNSSLVHRDGKAKDKHVHKIVNNITYKDHASHYENCTINNIMKVPQGECSRSIVAEDESVRKRTFEFNEAVTTDFRMNSLYHYLYTISGNFGSKKGLRKFIVRERCRIYEDYLEDLEKFNLMIMDVYDLILDTVNFKDWYGEHLHEEDFGCYWKSIFDIIFRGTHISLIRKIDLIFKDSILDDKNIKKNIELSSVEIKPSIVSEDVEAIQLNKNIRVNKSILHNIAAHMGEHNDDCYDCSRPYN